jgi:hypothetical protein
MCNTNSESPVLRFFRKVILEYNCGDVKWLLKKKSPAIGPLIATVSTGIDTVGGMLFGFATGSERRSVDFMKAFMGLDEGIAETIYRCARCGYLHEGIGKLNFSWFADYERVRRGCILFRRKDGGLALNVAEFAHQYLDAIKSIWIEKRGQLRHLPEARSKDESAFAVAARSAPGLDEVLRFYDNRLDDIRGSHSHEDVLQKMKYWQFDGYPSPDSENG